MSSLASPASFSQRSMWAAAMRARGAPLDAILFRWHLRGPLDQAALLDAMRRLWLRQPSLRAVLIGEAGRLTNVVQASAEPPVEHVETTSGSLAKSLEQAIAAGSAASRATANLSLGPTTRVQLAKVENEHHLLSFITHHAFCDGWSGQVIASDMAEYYASSLLGREPRLAPLLEHASSFAAAQTRASQEGAYEEELEYWRAQLAESPEPPALPLNGSRKHVRDMSCETVVSLSAPETLFAIREVARSRRLTVFSLLTAALAIQLHERAGARDLLLGVSTLNRWSERALRFVGSCTNLLPLRVRVNSDDAWPTLAMRVQKSMRELIAHGRVPFELIQRDRNSGLLGQSMSLPVWCQFREAAPVEHAEGTGLTFYPLPIERPALACDLEVDWLATDAGLRIEWAYRSALLDPSVVGAWQRDHVALLTMLATNRDLTVREMAAALG